MSDLIVIRFNDEYRAAEVLASLGRMQKEHVVDLEDAAVVTKNAEGKVKVQQTVDMTAGRGAIHGAFWGLLFGMIFFVPVFGALWGIGLGALMGKLTDLGVDDKFMKQVGDEMKPGNSAIFFLLRKATKDRFLDALSQFEGTVYQTSLSKEAEAELQKALESADFEKGAE